MRIPLFDPLVLVTLRSTRMCGHVGLLTPNPNHSSLTLNPPLAWFGFRRERSQNLFLCSVLTCVNASDGWCHLMVERCEFLSRSFSSQSIFVHSTYLKCLSIPRLQYATLCMVHSRRRNGPDIPKAYPVMVLYFVFFFNFKGSPLMVFLCPTWLW